MSIPTKFNPMGARVCSGGNDTPPPIVYKDFVQPYLLGNDSINRDYPYSFGMSIANDYGNATAWQAFDSDAMSMWQLTNMGVVYLDITFEHPVLIEEVQAVWEQPDKMYLFSVSGWDDEWAAGGSIVMVSGPSVKGNSFPVRNPKEFKNVRISIAQSGSSVVSINFIGKYNAIYDNAE